VRQLVAGASALICDECVLICDDIVTQSAARRPEGSPANDEIRICLVCKRGSDEADSVVVPDRGPVCRPCIDRIRAAAGI